MRSSKAFVTYGALAVCLVAFALTVSPAQTASSAPLNNLVATVYPTSPPIVYITPIPVPIQAQPSGAVSVPYLTGLLITTPLYSEPRTDSNNVGSLVQGQTWFVLGTDTTGRWVKVQVTSSTSGWATRVAFNLGTVQLPVIAGFTGGRAPGFFARSTFRGARFVYFVQRGDTLLKIALRYHVSLVRLANFNRIRNINRIFVGQRLFIP